MHYPVRLVIEPGAFIDLGIIRVIFHGKIENTQNFVLLAAEMAAVFLDILNNLPAGRIIVAPLIRIAVFLHEPAGLGVKIEYGV